MEVQPNFKKSYTIQSQITLLDTVPALAMVSGLSVHRDWEGCSADEIFQ
jgi:hypothetical protein